MIARTAAKAWACLLKDARIDASYKVAFAIDAIDALLMIVAYGVLARLFGDQTLDGFSPLGFLLVGVACNGALMTALVCFAQAVRGVQAAGAIKAVLATPTSPLAVVLLSSVYPFVRAGIDLLLWLAAAVLLGAPTTAVTPASVLAAVLVFLMAATAMAGFGFVGAAFAVVFKRGDPIMWLFGAASLLLSGVLYPVSSLPPRLIAVSAWLPSTHALDGLRAALLGGAGVPEVGSSLVALGLFSLIGVPLGLAVLGWSVRYARQEGTLGHV